MFTVHIPESTDGDDTADSYDFKVIQKDANCFSTKSGYEYSMVRMVLT